MWSDGLSSNTRDDLILLSLPFEESFEAVFGRLYDDLRLPLEYSSHVHQQKRSRCHSDKYRSDRYRAMSLECLLGRL